MNLHHIQKIQIYLYWSKYPQPLPFKYGPIVMEDQLWMISAYRMTNETVDKDLLEMFDGYPLGLWAAIVGSLFLFVGAMIIGRWFMEKKKGFFEPLWIVSMFTLDQDHLKESNNFLILVSFSMSFFCFFMTQYLLCGMGTELVVMKDPLVLKSYQDVIDKPDATPLFLKGWPDYKEFKLAPKNSLRSKLWQHAKEVQKIRKQEPFTKADGTLFGLAEQLLDRKVTLILSKDFARLITRLTAEGFQTENEKILISRNGAEGKLATFLFSPGMDEENYRFVYLKFQRMIEHGIVARMFEQVLERVMEPRPSLMQKFGERIQKEDRRDPEENVKIKFKNVYFTFSMISVLYVFSVFVLLVEKTLKRSRITPKEDEVLFKTVRPPPRKEDDSGIQAIPVRRRRARRKEAVVTINRMQKDIQNLRIKWETRPVSED